VGSWVELMSGTRRGVGFVRGIGVLFLLVQGVAVVLWWGLLLVRPEARGLFVAPGAPESTLLAFSVGDLLVYASSSLAAAYGLARERSWAWGVLLFHSGAAIYAALYALALALISGGAWLGAVMMAPALVVLPVLLRYLRPGARG
jgi:hypothetical protein